MSRVWCGALLILVATIVHAQANRAPELPAGMGTGGEFQSKNVDPKAVEIPLYAGALVSDVLTALTEKGFRIRWSPEQVLPSMILHERPKATRIDYLLNEILEPWGMKADPDLMKGGYLVRKMKKKKSKVTVESPPSAQ
jgi:hypothetical protein